MLKSHRSLWVSFSRTAPGLCMYHLFVWSNFNFLHNSQWITLPTQSCLVLHSFCANLLCSLIMWLMVSFLSPHNLRFLFCSVLSIFALIWLVHIALFYVALQERFIFSLKFSFLCHVHVFSCETPLISRLKTSILGIRLQDSAFLSEVALNHLKKARGEIWPKRSEKRNNTKTTKMRKKKSAINKLKKKKLILRSIKFFFFPFIIIFIIQHLPSFSLQRKSEKQQVSTGLQDSSQYSELFIYLFILNLLIFISIFYFLNSYFHSSCECYL